MDLDKRGLPPQPSMVRNMAKPLLAQNGNRQFGEDWVYNLDQSRPDLEWRFVRGYKYERAICGDQRIIQVRIRQATLEYGILAEDI